MFLFDLQCIYKFFGQAFYGFGWSLSQVFYFLLSLLLKTFPIRFNLALDGSVTLIGEIPRA